MIALTAATLLHILKLFIAYKKRAVVSNLNNTEICFCGDNRIMHLISIILKIKYENLLKRIADYCIVIIEISEQLVLNKFSIIRMFETHFYFGVIHSWLIAIYIMALNFFKNRYKFYSMFCLLIPEYYVPNFEKVYSKQYTYWNE